MSTTFPTAIGDSKNILPWQSNLSMLDTLETTPHYFHLLWQLSDQLPWHQLGCQTTTLCCPCPITRFHVKMWSSSSHSFDNIVVPTSLLNFHRFHHSKCTPTYYSPLTILDHFSNDFEYALLCHYYNLHQHSQPPSFFMCKYVTCHWYNKIDSFEFAGEQSKLDPTFHPDIDYWLHPTPLASLTLHLTPKQTHHLNHYIAVAH